MDINIKKNKLIGVKPGYIKFASKEFRASVRGDTGFFFEALFLAVHSANAPAK